MTCKKISQIYHSITKVAVVGHVPSILLNALHNRTVKSMKDFDSFGVVQVIYAHAKLSTQVTEPLRTKMIQFIIAKCSIFNGQDVANTLYSIRKKCLDPIDKPVRKCIIGLLTRWSIEYSIKPMEIENIVWSASMTLNNFNSKIPTHSTEYLFELSSKFDVQHVAMVLEGFVVGEVIFDEAFVNAILETISNQISSSDTFSMQNFSSILHSLRNST